MDHSLKIEGMGEIGGGSLKNLHTMIFISGELLIAVVMAFDSESLEFENWINNADYWRLNL